MASNHDNMTILVINCGSSSLKFRVYKMPEGEVLAKGAVDRIGEDASALTYHRDGGSRQKRLPVADHREAMEVMLSVLVGEDGVIEDAGKIDAVGHRMVHGAEEFTGSVLITDEVIASVERYSELAPLHNPLTLSGVRAALASLPGVPQIACFDTAFHTTIPETAYIYPLPYELYETHGVRRYGFHGTSHRYVAHRAAELLGLGKYDINCVTVHLGNGCSATAVRGGRSVDTSMGLTPLEGLVMGTRSGDFDPAILFHLAQHGYDMPTLNELCNKQSGLLGISGSSNDMRTLAEKAAQGNRRAQLAFDIFCYRVKKYIGAYVAVLGKTDAVVFTGGIGENSAAVRAAVCADLDQLGITLDPDRNERTVGGKEGPVTVPDSSIQVLVVPTDEEGAIAADTYEIVAQG